MGLIQNKVKVSQPVSHIIIEQAGGLKGETGAPGVPGQAATVSVGTTTTLPAGSDATVENVGSPQDAILNFGIPQGIQGPAGVDGQSATISVGTTTTLPAGSSATVSNTGTASAAIFNFGIPKGDKGDKGDTGSGLTLSGTVATYAELPNNLTPADAGKAYLVEADGKLYVWSGTAFPADGAGTQFEGPEGPEGPAGYSPTATVTKIDNTATISITDKNGTTTAQISDGSYAAVDDTLSLSSTNPVQNKVVTAALNNKQDTLEQGDITSDLLADYSISSNYLTGQGTDFTLHQTISGTTFTEVEADGDTSQTTLTGKNLFGVADYTTNWGGGSSSCTNNEITISGTPTANYIGIVPNNTALSTTIPAGTYTLRLNKTLPFTIYVNLVQTDNTTKWFTITPNATSYTNTLTAPATKVVSWSDMTGISGQTYNITGLQIQFEAGSTASSFEQYCGGVPSPNPDYPQFVNTATGLQTIEVVKDNLYNADDAQGYKWLDASTGQISNSNDPNVVSGYISTTVGTTYYISGTDQFKIRAFGYSDTTSDKAITYINYGETTRSFTATYPYLRFAIGGGDAVSKISSFGVYASDDYQKYTINLGKNLCDGVNTNYWVGATTNMTYGRSTGNTGLILPVDSNTNYTISTTETQARYRLGLGDEALELNGSSTIYDKVLKDGTSDSVALNSGSHKCIVINATDLTKIQIERGSTATAYSEYFTPIELCKIGTYQDYIYKSGDDWYIHKETTKRTLNGSENWTLISGSDFYYPSGLGSGYSDNETNAIADKLRGLPGSSLSGTNYITLIENGNLRINYSGITTVSALQTALSSNNITCYLALATPTDTKITNATLISELNALLSANVYADETEVSVSSNDLKLYLKVKAQGNSKLAYGAVITPTIADGAVTVAKISDLQALADALRPYLS